MQMLLKEFRRFLKEYKVESILIIITIFILTTGAAYSDFYATTRHGIEFWTVLFEGHPLQFYKHCYEIGWGNDIYYGNAGCAYDFSVYIVFAAWNFPVWIVEKIFGINAQDNLLCVVWGKMLMVCAMLLSVKLLCEIYSLITENRGGRKQKDFLVLNYLSSLLLLSYTVASGNYDILAIVVMLYGIENYLKGNYRKFLIWFMIAVTFKYFAAFIFIPLVLLKEKRILFIIKDMMILISLSVVEKLIFTTQHISSVSDSAGGTFLGLMQGVTVAGKIEIEGIGTVSLLFVLYAALAIYCYMQSDSENTHFFKKKTIYVCLCSWVIFFTLVAVNSYWIVLIVPFLTLVLQSGNKNKKMSYLMEAIFSAAMFLALNMRQNHILGGITCMRMIPHRILCFFFPKAIQVSGYRLGQFLLYINDKFNIRIYLNSICLITLIVFVVINFPKKSENNDISEEQESVYVRNRLLVNTGLSLVPIVLYVLQIFYWQATH